MPGFLHRGFSLLNSECNSFLLREGVTRLNATVGSRREHSAIPSAEKKIKRLHATSWSTSALHDFHSKQHQHFPEI